MIISPIAVEIKRKEPASYRPEKPPEDLRQLLNFELPPVSGFARRVWKQSRMMHYNRLIVCTLLVNLAILWMSITTWNWWTAEGINLQGVSHVLLANLSLAILIRQQAVINMLFWLATRAPTSWPLKIRWTLAKVYHFGGFHVGGAIAGTFWFAGFLGALLHQYALGVPGISAGTMWVTGVLLILLVVMIIASLPKFRAKYHDTFERVHRFGGWTSLVLFWIQTVMFINDQSQHESLANALGSSIGFWMLVILTASILFPWLRLRKVPIEVLTPSSHAAIVRFNHGVTPFAGSSTALSRNPLLEWHSFANVPAPNEEGFRLIISRAGDWTGSFIDDKPSHVWVKGITTAGVANIELLFKRVVYVATGSGIGPVLPHLLMKHVPSHLVWSTRNPRKTYGDALVDEILDAEPNAVIWDTDALGKPNMVKLAYRAYKEFDAEAVICISNKKLTWQVVEGLESRGIPAYGAIWDS